LMNHPADLAEPVTQDASGAARARCIAFQHAVDRLDARSVPPPWGVPAGLVGAQP
jgi:hypothetical protein